MLRDCFLFRSRDSTLQQKQPVVARYVRIYLYLNGHIIMELCTHTYIYTRTRADHTHTYTRVQHARTHTNPDRANRPDTFAYKCGKDVTAYVLSIESKERWNSVSESDGCIQSAVY